jgi:hypothetical protein
VTARKSQSGTHAKCLTTTTRDGQTLVCWKSPEHADSKDPDRREHYDPSADRRWTT